MWYKKSLFDIFKAVLVYTLLTFVSVYILKPEISFVLDPQYLISVRGPVWSDWTNLEVYSLISFVVSLIIGSLALISWSLYNKIRYGKLARRQSGIGIVSRTKKDSAKVLALQQSAHVQVYLGSNEKIDKIVQLDKELFNAH